jgi:hypothetical protein
MLDCLAVEDASIKNNMNQGRQAGSVLRIFGH